MDQTTIIFIYIPCRDAEQAAQIGRDMVEARHAACANIFPDMRSIYRWDDKLCEDKEAVLILKTTKDKFAEVEQAVRARHSYQTPCIVSLAVCDINDAYCAWLLGNITR